jgi:transcriptional regulator with XRE-family HTH domain
MPSVRWSDDQRSAFAVRMRAARTHSGLSQQDAAKRIGIKQGSLSELEKTATKSAHTAKAASVYKVSARWLQDGTGSMLATPHAFSERAAFIAARLDEISDQAAFDHACVLCEAFAALAKAGDLASLVDRLALVGPALAPRTTPTRAQSKRSAAADEKQA